MDGSLIIQYRPTKRTGKLKTRPGIKLRTFLSILLRTGILPLLVLRSGSITFSFVPPQHNTLFVFRGTRLFSLVVIYTAIDFYYLQVSFPLLFLRSELITVYYTSQQKTPLILGVSVSRSGILHKCKSNTSLSLSQYNTHCSSIVSSLSQGGKQTYILLKSTRIVSHIV